MTVKVTLDASRLQGIADRFKDLPAFLKGRAYTRALKRTATKVTTTASKAALDNYNIRAGDFKKTMTKTFPGNKVLKLSFVSRRYGLGRFSPRQVKKAGGVVVKVKRKTTVSQQLYQTKFGPLLITDKKSRKAVKTSVKKAFLINRSRLKFGGSIPSAEKKVVFNRARNGRKIYRRFTVSTAQMAGNANVRGEIFKSAADAFYTTFESELKGYVSSIRSGRSFKRRGR